MNELHILRAALADARQQGNMEAYTIILRGIAALQRMEALAELPTAHLPVVSQEVRAA